MAPELTAELGRRPARAADYEAESRTLAELMRTMADGSLGGDASPTARITQVLQMLAERALTLCRAHSCGIGLLEEKEGREVFHWRAVAAPWARCQASIDLPIVEELRVPIHHAGEPVGALWVAAHDESPQFDAEDRRLLTSLARFASLAYQSLHQHQQQQQLSRDLQAMEQLETIGTLRVPEGGVEVVYERILDAVITAMDSDFASFQILHPECGSSGELRLLGHRGFGPRAVELWTSVDPQSESSCAAALRTRERCIVADTETSPLLARSATRQAYREVGIRAMQSTPLISRSGELLGMLSTHWRRPHQPPQRDLRLLDALARQAADLIERTQTEHALRERNAELAEQDRRKDLFLATLGHELRNPLGVLDLGAQLLRQGGDPAAVQGMLERNIQQLKAIVNDLLDVSRITRGKLELNKEAVNLAALVRSALQVWRAAIRDKQQQLTTDLPERAIAEVDPMRFEQIVANLLANAVKYTPARGAIHVQLLAQEHDIVLSVSDSGQGLCTQDLRAIFEPFIQVNAEMGGLGIGLPVAKGLVELHGGSLSVESAGIGCGCAFRVRLPLGSAREPRRPCPAQFLRLPADLRVLVVDDIEDYADSQALILRAQGCQASAVHSGLEAVRCCAQAPPHVVLLDLGLPDLSGYEVAERLRREPAVSRTWIIAVSGFGDRGVQARARAAGFDRLLIKPVNERLLHELFLARIVQGL